MLFEQAVHCSLALFGPKIVRQKKAANDEDLMFHYETLILKILIGSNEPDEKSDDHSSSSSTMWGYHYVKRQTNTNESNTLDQNQKYFI